MGARKMTTEREANIYEAKLAEQAERYDEMVAAIKKVAASLKTGEGLSVEERNIFSVAYKNVIGSRRATWRIVSSILKKEEDRPEKIEMRIKHARALANKVEGEMNSICNDCLKVIDAPDSSGPRAQLLRVLLRDPVVPREGLPDRQAGLRRGHQPPRRHRRGGVQGRDAHHAAHQGQPHALDF